MKVAAYAAPVHWNNKNWAAFAKAKLVLGAPRTGTPLMQHTILQAANLISPGCEQISQCIINQRHEIAAAPQVHQVINCRLETQRLLPSGLNSCPFFLSLYFIRSDDVGLQAPIQFYHGGKRPAAVHFKEELARRKWWQRRKRWMNGGGGLGGGGSAVVLGVGGRGRLIGGGSGNRGGGLEGNRSAGVLGGGGAGLGEGGKGKGGLRGGD
eukprot:CAMPEP_0202392430 /NCGR_PEP_ID=MMETSP1127-20130417/92369_1 /ASSEMBLY_ACC=CAM_ASM_000462 /TAXON_ID=3047 /ORGANISM="Dunaliella tertiolecta, Strain CCMP1320" /LENGTH=209 /DNA_ID=CAMNT_0048994937 /DNA_START=947 /DNA_END=1577 /DNA_ORIENTATION=+